MNLKKYINTQILTIEEILEKYDYSQILEKIFMFEEVNNRIELDKQLLMYNYGYNDIEALQLIDTYVLQQYYITRNVEVLENGLTIKSKVFFRSGKCVGIPTVIGLN